MPTFWVPVSNQNTLYYDLRLFVNVGLLTASCWEVSSVTSLVSRDEETWKSLFPLNKLQGARYTLGINTTGSSFTHSGFCKLPSIQHQRHFPTQLFT